MIASDLVLEKAYEVKYYEQNLKNELKESSLLNFLQDAATVSAENLGFGPSFVFSNNLAWFVLKYHIELSEPVKNTDSVVIKTEPRGAHRLYAYRDFGIYLPDGKKIGFASSLWALVDMGSKRMLPMEKALPDMFKYEKRDSDPDFAKIPPLESEKISFEKEFEVKFDDVDVNQHANNANYIIWALESLPHEFRMNHSPAVIDIKYRKEIKMGGKILSQSQSITPNTTIHLIREKESGEELCYAQFVWK